MMAIVKASDERERMVILFIILAFINRCTVIKEQHLVRNQKKYNKYNKHNMTQPGYPLTMIPNITIPPLVYIGDF